MSGWQTRATRTVYENAWVRVREDAVTRPDGSDGVYGVIEMKHPAVFIVPVTEAGEVLLVRMHRYPIGRESVEVPAGGTDGEEPLVAARRELLEETGRSAATWTRLGEFYSLNGVADARADVFLAQRPHAATGRGTTRRPRGSAACCSSRGPRRWTWCAAARSTTTRRSRR